MCLRVLLAAGHAAAHASAAAALLLSFVTLLVHRRQLDCRPLLVQLVDNVVSDVLAMDHQFYCCHCHCNLLISTGIFLIAVMLI